MIQQLPKEDVVVFGACSLHGEIDNDERSSKRHQLSGRQLQTVCVEKNLHFSGNKHGTKLWN